MIKKNKRWIETDYRRWVATHPCANCGIHDETIVAHHLKHRHAPYGGDYIFKTLTPAFRNGILVYKPKLLMSKDEQRQWREKNLHGEELDD